MYLFSRNQKALNEVGRGLCSRTFNLVLTSDVYYSWLEFSGSFGPKKLTEISTENSDYYRNIEVTLMSLFEESCRKLYTSFLLKTSALQQDV